MTLGGAIAECRVDLGEMAALWRIMLLRDPLVRLKTTRPPVFELQGLIHTSNNVFQLRNLHLSILLPKSYFSRSQINLLVIIASFDCLLENA